MELHLDKKNTKGIIKSNASDKTSVVFVFKSFYLFSHNSDLFSHHFEVPHFLAHYCAERPNIFETEIICRSVSIILFDGTVSCLLLSAVSWTTLCVIPGPETQSHCAQLLVIA